MSNEKGRSPDRGVGDEQDRKQNAPGQRKRRKKVYRRGPTGLPPANLPAQQAPPPNPFKDKG